MSWSNSTLALGACIEHKARTEIYYDVMIQEIPREDGYSTFQRPGVGFRPSSVKGVCP